MNLKEEIINELDLLKKIGWTRRKIESEFGYREKSIDQNLSKGGTKPLLNRLKTFHSLVLNKATSKVGAEVKNLKYGEALDYKEKYIQLLEKQVDTLENKVLASLNSISVNVTQGRAEVRGSIEYEAIKDAKGDQKRKEAIMVEINKLINLNLPVTQELGSQVSSGR